MQPLAHQNHRSSVNPTPPQLHRACYLKTAEAGALTTQTGSRTGRCTAGATGASITTAAVSAVATTTVAAPATTVATTTVAAPAYTEVTPSGCCRTASGGGGTVPAGSAGYFATTTAGCEAACTAQSSCTGYEYQEWGGGNCEIHTSPDDYDHADVVGSGVCRCFEKSTVPTTVATTTVVAPATTVATTTVAAPATTVSATVNPRRHA